ncbi:MarR family transcriptional regulator [Kribbella jejuensis]|uniref:DNA-binding MarR family transcriptional regulator n=1 Tax=Kribbella jejuensis TaxID=236068 RepID=A0A542EV49_9ACTN|nr:MarR family transcriptional regulator [Kribbella jejuensis]TQJ19232.1 DNA-binding MarR family transcriptional regulator [Kribbella jejuensis]
MPEFLELHSKTSKLLRTAADNAVQRHGLRLGQDHLLAALWAQDGRTPGEIAAAVNVTTPAVTKLANRMAESGLLERRPDPHDNRLVRLWLTPAGRALQAPIEAERQQLEDRITATLTKSERAQLIKALTKIHQALLDDV